MKRSIKRRQARRGMKRNMRRSSRMMRSIMRREEEEGMRGVAMRPQLREAGTMGLQQRQKEVVRWWSNDDIRRHH
jgi:hypothetical protein